MGSILGSQDPNLSGFGQFVPVQVSQVSARAHDPDFVLGDLDPLCESPQMIAPKSAVFSTHSAAGDGREFHQFCRSEALVGILQDEG